MVVLWLCLLAGALLFWRLTSTFGHWKAQGVPYLTPYPVVGSLLPVVTLRQSLFQFHRAAYCMFRTHRYVGLFQGPTPTLLVRDPELIKSILIKDFSHFVDRGFKGDKELNPLQARNLSGLQGQQWREMRAKLSPTFTSGRMKAMFPLVLEVAERLEKHLTPLAEQQLELHVKDLLARYTTDVIGSCAFGLQCNSIEDPECEFRVMGRRILEGDSISSLKRLAIALLPEVAKFLRLKFLSEDTETFFRSLVHTVISQRSGVSSPAPRRDFMQLMLELKERGFLTGQEEENVSPVNLTDDDLVAHALAFFFAGFETSSTALTFALYELAHQPELQQRARAHIEEVLARHGGELTYQALKDMTYLDWIFQETLRMYPPVPMLMRECTVRYAVPDSTVVLEKGTKIMIPIFALHHDMQHFPGPDRFDPERFSERGQQNRHQFTYLPFGEGPRQCIGLRFANMQSKVGLVSILRRFEVVPCARTPRIITWDTSQFVLTPQQEVVLTLRTTLSGK